MGSKLGRSSGLTRIRESQRGSSCSCSGFLAPPYAATEAEIPERDFMKESSSRPRRHLMEEESADDR
ncbi:hypothetical protein MA16_Dca006798 [Dendrobium catenatum]|uniref:Uncharacterized protein n=1 Tax=Dendrobium catenatum TaxID=906689 RepID=A0A2I0W972_9ASPA|nr:hypothetical protein MA16_Dca006798 [Dendrobium catenatum]